MCDGTRSSFGPWAEIIEEIVTLVTHCTFKLQSPLDSVIPHQRLQKKTRRQTEKVQVAALLDDMILTVGVLALQGGFLEHVSLLSRAVAQLKHAQSALWQNTDTKIVEVRNPDDLARCEALIIPGGESTTIALVAAQCSLLEPLRHFVKVDGKPTWGTCAGLVLLSEEATAIKKGGQELIGGLDVRVQRNHFGRQMQSFIADVDLPFLGSSGESQVNEPFPGVFIRAPIVERLLTSTHANTDRPGEPAGGVTGPSNPAEVLAVLRRRTRLFGGDLENSEKEGREVENIVAVRQGNIVGTSFHPELTDDIRMHVWWLGQVLESQNKPLADV